MRPTRGEELQLLELSSCLSQSQGAREQDWEHPQQPATAILLPPHTGSVQPLHIYVSRLRVPRKIRKERKTERTKRKKETAPVLRLQGHISVYAEEFVLLYC